jgi:hypothetical protein
MKNIFQTLKSVYADRLNIILFSAIIIVFVADFFIWRLRLRYEDIYIFTLNGVYPIRFLGIILLVNTFVSIFSYEKEKEISYLLFSASLFISILILVLEMFYLINLNYA